MAGRRGTGSSGLSSAEGGPVTAEWRRWGPYVSERAWGTVREDYSADGDAWRSFPFEHARSRAYRWSEDGLGGICDEDQHRLLAFAFWNGHDPILKERIFGLDGPQGNHGEDAKELWWYLDSTPTHSWMRWAYLYPQAEFPYERLIAENARRGRMDDEYELWDTGVLDGGWWDVVVDYAKAAPDDWCIRLRARNAGTEAATLHVLPTVWFRNTWSWSAAPAYEPSLTATAQRIDMEHLDHGPMVLTTDGTATPLACANESNARLLWDVDGPAFPKDGIGDHVVHGAPTVNPAGTGTKGALWFVLDVAPGDTAEIRLRFAPEARPIDETWTAALADREREADEYYAGLAGNLDADAAAVMRQAFAGMMWGKQFFHYDVERWLDGDPGQPPPPVGRNQGRNHLWRHLNNHDVISMPDSWEYPWYASWDLAFHCVAIAHVDPAFAKHQLLLLCREWYMHPNGQIPAYEWSFDDVNPPVQAWAAMRVFEIDGDRDYDFLGRMLHKLLINFTWWVNRKDAEGNNVFEGGFLGLDNIGPIDRSAPLPVAGTLEQADGTAWMAMYCLDLLEMSITLARHDATYEDVATKFLEHFAYIAKAVYDRGMWDEQDGFYYDIIALDTGEELPLRVRSMVGLLPLAATITLGRETMAELPNFTAHLEWFADNKPTYAAHIDQVHVRDTDEGRLLSVVTIDQLRRLLRYLLDPAELLSPYGVRALSAFHRDHPFRLTLGGTTYEVGYEPAESRSLLFGGNSNWRGPVWFPVNYLVVAALRRFAAYFGGDLLVEDPTGSGAERTLDDIADDLEHRLTMLFRRGSDGRRACFGDVALLQDDPVLRDRLLFHEYFDGDDGTGLGASHQTGWTGLVADLLARHAGRPEVHRGEP
ncbi:MAG: hypothetical protein QM733_07690 [Ilumatobacteraceae bacterium]